MSSVASKVYELEALIRELRTRKKRQADFLERAVAEAYMVVNTLVQIQALLETSPDLREELKNMNIPQHLIELLDK